MKPEDNQLTPQQRLDRERAFATWLFKSRHKLGMSKIPLELTHEVQWMLRKAFNAGTNYEARMAALEAQDEH